MPQTKVEDAETGQKQADDLSDGNLARYKPAVNPFFYGARVEEDRRWRAAKRKRHPHDHS